MASFIGGESLARIVDYDNNISPAQNITIHTIPAKRYAKVFILEANSLIDIRSGSGQPRYLPASVPTENDYGAAAANFSNVFPNGLIFDEGEQVTLISASGDFKIVILEYNKPDSLSLP